MIIDELIAKYGELNTVALNEWLTNFKLTSAKAAELLEANPRSFESWRAGRYKVPKLLVFTLRLAERKISNNKGLKNKPKKVK